MGGEGDVLTADSDEVVVTTTTDPEAGMPDREARWTVPEWARWAPAAFLAVMLARLIWLAWSASSRGVDMTDEGIYLVSYRYYRHPEMVFNGAPAFFGPLFQLVGYSVVWLRRIKIVLILGTGFGLGWSTVVFVRMRRAGETIVEDLPKRVAVILFVMTGAFTMYTWLPQSPGYNDLSMLCAVGIAAAVLPPLADRSIVARWNLIGAGAIIAVAVINKWPAGLCMIGVVAVAFVLARGWWSALRGIGWSVLGVLGGCVVLAVFGGPFFTRLTELRSASEKITDALPIKDAYLIPYWHNLTDVLGLVVDRVWFVLIVGALLAIAVPVRHAALSAAWVVGSILVVLRRSSKDSVFYGGNGHVQHSQLALPLLLGLAAAVWAVGRVVAFMSNRRGEAPALARDHEPRGVPAARSRGAALVLLLGLGAAQAFGTLNVPLYVVLSAGALFAASMTIVFAGAIRSWRPAMVPVAMLLVALPIATERMMRTGMWDHPYDVATDLDQQDQPLRNVIGYDGLSTDKDTAALLEGLSALSREHHLAGRPGLDVSFSPGYTIAMGLVQPPADLFITSGDSYSGIYAARIITACERGFIDPDAPPVILAAGPTVAADVTADFAACGIDLPGDFDRELVKSSTGVIGVWIPRDAP